MGRDKALLPMSADCEHVSFLGSLTGVLLTLCGEVVLVTRDDQQAAEYAEHLAVQKAVPTRIVSDAVPAAGPLMGLYSGLSALHASHALVMAVDMPYVHRDLLTFLLSYPLDESILLPRVDGIPQVLLAVYPRTILPALAACLQAGRRDLRSLLEVVPVHYIEEPALRAIDPQLRSFININTPDDLALRGTW